MGKPEDHVGCAVFLASPESDYIVAQTYNVDGGQLDELSMTQALPRQSPAASSPASPCRTTRPSDLTPGILHFGLGNFHRAHQAVYLDTLFNMGKSHDWAHHRHRRAGPPTAPCTMR